MTATLGRPKLRDATILDQYGQPVSSPLTRRLVAAANPKGMQTFNHNPIVGLTTELLASILRTAELGVPFRQCDLFDNMLERYAMMRGEFLERNEEVSGCDFAVLPPPNRNDRPSRIAAAALEEYLQYSVTSYVASPGTTPSTCFRTWLEWQLTSVPMGYAASNLVWDYVENLVVPTRFEPIAHRRFGAPNAERANELWLIDGARAPFDLIELEPGLWSVTRYLHRNPFAAGLMRSCAWWVMFALLSLKQWQIFADMFGLPLAIGYYEEGASLPSRETLESAVRMIGQDGYAVLSSMTELVIKETARGGDSSTVYPLIMKAAEAQITKLITGGTLNTDVSSTGAGSYNAAKVHESRGYKMKRRDATRVQDVFAESIGRTFIAWNGFDRAAPPRLYIKISRDDLAWAQALEIIGSAVKLSKSQIREQFGLRPPNDGDDESDAVMFPSTKPPDPGHARSDKGDQ
jgi:phage gp29-like protein